ncbi:MAG: BTAD domain-containing putative transcriptional regulator [Candidatus Eisenbacteria bacterium]|nr:BTAD domain-containing putative transcriptional regulator [Candidatus Eisenbacteria bacterium]
MNRPAASPLLPRPRLLRALREGCKAVLLTAPAGCGKTALLTQFAARADPLWCRLRPEDKDPGHLLGSLLACAGRLRNPIGSSTRALYDARRDMERDGGFLTSTFLSDLIAGRRTRWLVFDDAHQVRESPDAVRWLQYLIEESGPSVRFLLSSREEIPLRTARLSLLGGARTLTASDLAFSRHEIVQVVRHRTGRILSRQQAASLRGQTGGWAVAVSFAARLLEDRKIHVDDLLRDWGAHANRDLAAYLSQEVLASLPEIMRDALLQLSPLEDLDPVSVRFVLGERRGDAFLAEVHRLDPFLRTPLDADEPPRFHPFFRDFLRSEMQARVPRAKSRAAWRRLTAHQARLGHETLAIRTALAARDATAAVRLFEQARRSRCPPSFGVLVHLADRILTECPGGSSDPLRHPWIHFHAAHQSQKLRRFEEALSRHRASRIGFLANGNHLQAARSFRQEAATATMTGAMEETIREGKQLLRLLPAHAKHARGIVHLEIGALQLGAGDPTHARRSIELAQRLLARCELHEETANARERLADLAFTEGRWDQYLLETDPVLRFLIRSGRATREQSLRINRAEALIYLGREEEAQASLSVAEALAGRSFLTANRALIAIGRARAASDAWQTGGLRSLFAHARKIARSAGSPVSALQLDLWEGVAERRRGRRAAASRLLRRAMEGFAELGSESWQARAAIEVGLIQGLEGRTAQALSLLDAAVRVSRAHRDRKEEAYVLLARACILRTAGRAYRPALHSCLEILESEDYFVLLRKERDLAVPLLRDAFRGGYSASRISRAVAALPDELREEVHKASRPAPDRTIGTRARPRVEVQLLGIFRVLVDGREVPFPRKGSRALIAHLALTRCPVSRDLLAERIWPGAPANASRNRFDVTLSIARRCLEPGAGPRGPFRLLLSESGMCRLAEGEIRLDVREFERKARACDPLVLRLLEGAAATAGGRRIVDRPPPSARDIDLLQDAIATYRGDLLDGESADAWIAARREDLRERFQRLLIASGRLALWRNRPEEALEAARRILEADPLSEAAMEIRMLALARTGQSPVAIRDYARFVKRLARGVGAAPDPRLEAAYRDLMAERFPRPRLRLDVSGRPESTRPVR